MSGNLNNHVTIVQEQVNFVKPLSRGQKKIIPRTIICSFRSINTVLFARLMHLLCFHQGDVFLTEIGLRKAGL